MQEFTDNDFKGLLLQNIINLKDTDDILEKYPILNKYHEFRVSIKNIQKVLKYISFIYDIHSPFHIINHVPTRKMEAISLAEIEDTVYANSIMQCTNKEVVSMIIRYIRIQKNPDFSQRVIFEESWYKQLEKMLTDDIDNSEKTKDLIGNVTKLKNSITELDMVLLNQDMNKGLTDALYDAIEEELMLRPETMAKLIKEEGMEGTKKYLKGDKKRNSKSL